MTMIVLIEYIVLTIFATFICVAVSDEYIYSRSCTEATSSTRRSGVYGIQNDLYGTKPFRAYCEEDLYGGGWTVILRRKDGSIDFYRKWIDYKQGFGNLEGEFFIGLDKLFAITNGPQTYEVIFILEDLENIQKFAKYSSFAIGDESEKYTLKSLGNYSGDAGDSFRIHGGFPFETFDSERVVQKCASTYAGAWWYNSCHQSNLCGRYLNGTYDKERYAQGVVWLGFRGLYYSLKTAQMMVRPQRFNN